MDCKNLYKQLLLFRWEWAKFDFTRMTRNDDDDWWRLLLLELINFLLETENIETKSTKKEVNQN